MGSGKVTKRIGSNFLYVRGGVKADREVAEASEVSKQA
jgi:hypothetical protein